MGENTFHVKCYEATTHTWKKSLYFKTTTCSIAQFGVIHKEEEQLHTTRASFPSSARCIFQRHLLPGLEMEKKCFNAWKL